MHIQLMIVTRQLKIEQLRFWCQYWILLAMLTVFERVGDNFVSWLPMYSEAKLTFIVYLWYPKTQGTSYVYESFFKPYIANHESEIDRNLLELRTRASDMAVIYFHKVADYSQARFHEILQYIASQSQSQRSRSQCELGHVLCSICYEKLPEKEKCQFCSTTKGYNRCFTIERLLKSLQVLCSNARCGCTAKMPYHEMEEHEKECRKPFCDSGSNAWQPTTLHHGLSTDHYTLVIPKVSPCTNINIRINNGEIKKKIHDNKSSEDSVVKMGPCGGAGGNAWKMDMRGVTRIFRVVVHHGGAVDAMSVLFERDGQEEEESNLWGGTGGKRSEICLRQDEYLTSVKGHYGFFNNWFVIKSLTFVSNQRTFGPYGKEEGAQFKLPAAGGKIIGFHGRSYGLLDALGTYVKMG